MREKGVANGEIQWEQAGWNSATNKQHPKTDRKANKWIPEPDY